MPKKAKVSDKENASPDGTTLNGNAAKPAAKKATSPRKGTTRRTAATKKEESRVSDEAIRIRAYFISEQRERLAIPGGSKRGDNYWPSWEKVERRDARLRVLSAPLLHRFRRHPRPVSSSPFLSRWERRTRKRQ